MDKSPVIIEAESQNEEEPIKLASSGDESGPEDLGMKDAEEDGIAQLFGSIVNDLQNGDKE